MVHELKTHPSVFEDVLYERKTFEYRFNDRNYMVGDTLKLMCYDPGTQSYVRKYPALFFKVTYIIHGGNFGIPEGYCIMSIKHAGL